MAAGVPRRRRWSCTTGRAAPRVGPGRRPAQPPKRQTSPRSSRPPCAIRQNPPGRVPGRCRRMSSRRRLAGPLTWCLLPPSPDGWPPDRLDGSPHLDAMMRRAAGDSDAAGRWRVRIAAECRRLESARRKRPWVQIPHPPPQGSDEEAGPSCGRRPAPPDRRVSDSSYRGATPGRSGSTGRRADRSRRRRRPCATRRPPARSPARCGAARPLP
jgi:hypothetical protein